MVVKRGVTLSRSAEPPDPSPSAPVRDKGSGGRLATKPVEARFRAAARPQNRILSISEDMILLVLVLVGNRQTGECLRSRIRAPVIASRRRRRGNLLPAEAEIAHLHSLALPARASVSPQASARARPSGASVAGARDNGSGHLRVRVSRRSRQTSSSRCGKLADILLLHLLPQTAKGVEPGPT
jgi:hypothetical protein